MKSAIDKARILMKCRDFAGAIQVLNEKREVYEESLGGDQLYGSSAFKMDFGFSQERYDS